MIILLIYVFLLFKGIPFKIQKRIQFLRVYPLKVEKRLKSKGIPLKSKKGVFPVSGTVPTYCVPGNRYVLASNHTAQHFRHVTKACRKTGTMSCGSWDSNSYLRSPGYEHQHGCNKQGKVAIHGEPWSAH